MFDQENCVPLCSTLWFDHITMYAINLALD